MQTTKPNQLKAWILAARPKTLAGAAVPVLIGSALAALHHTFAILPACLCLAFAFLMQINANFINDLFDYLKGSDGEDRLGPERACAQGWISQKAMQTGIGITTLFSVGIGLYIWYLGGIWMLPIGILCIIFAFFYTTGPYPLAYHGWGDVAVIVFFGLIPVGCTYYLMAGTYHVEVVVASFSCGLVINTLLIINNYRDREQDARNRKRTLVVRLGEKAGVRMYQWTGTAAVIASISCFRGYPWITILLLYLIPHLLTTREMEKINRGRALNRLLGKTSMNILLFGLLFTIACLLSC